MIDECLFNKPNKMQIENEEKKKKQRAGEKQREGEKERKERKGERESEGRMYAKGRKPLTDDNGLRVLLFIETGSFQ